MSRTSERDRTLSRVRRTTAVTGIGAVLAGGALAGWLGHAAADAAGAGTGSSSSSDGSSSSGDGLTSPATAPEAGSSSGSDAQPGVTSGGS